MRSRRVYRFPLLGLSMCLLLPLVLLTTLMILSYFFFRSVATSLKSLKRLKHVLVWHEPDTPWHLQTTAILSRTAWKNRINENKDFTRIIKSALLDGLVYSCILKIIVCLPFSSFSFLCIWFGLKLIKKILFVHVPPRLASIECSPALTSSLALPMSCMTAYQVCFNY